MAKYVIDSSATSEIKELKDKCRLVKSKIAKIGASILPANHADQSQPAPIVELPTDSGFDYSIIIDEEGIHNAPPNMPNRVFRIWSTANTK